MDKKVRKEEAKKGLFSKLVDLIPSSSNVKKLKKQDKTRHGTGDKQEKKLSDNEYNNAQKAYMESKKNKKR